LIVVGLTGAALTLPAAMGSAGRVSADPASIARADAGDSWSDALVGLMGAGGGAVVPVVALAVGLWALLRALPGVTMMVRWFGVAVAMIGLLAGWLPWEAAAAAVVVPPAGSLGGHGGPAAGRWEQIASELRAQFDAGDREAFGGAMRSLRGVLALHDAYRAALDPARLLSEEAMRWMGPVGQLALRGELGSGAVPDDVPDAALHLVERDRILLGEFADTGARQLWPATLRSAARRLSDFHQSLGSAVEQLVGRQVGTAVPLYRESMHLSDRHRGRGFDEVLDEAKAAALEVVHLANQTAWPLGWSFEGKFALSRLYAAVAALAEPLPHEQPVADLVADLKESSALMDRDLNLRGQLLRDEVDAVIDAADQLWLDQLYEWTYRDEQNPVRALLSTYEWLRTLDEAPAERGEVERLLADTVAARQSVEARFADRSGEDVGPYTDLAVEFARLHRRALWLDGLLVSADSRGDGSRLDGVRREFQERAAAEMARRADEPGAQEYRSAVAEYLTERRQALLHSVPDLSGAELTQAIAQRTLRFATRPATSASRIDRIRWDDAVAELLGSVDRLDEYPPGSAERIRQVERARLLLNILDELLDPDSPSTGNESSSD
jgi:hypothetical protein